MSRLFGERIMLREYRREDLEHMRKWVNDPKVVDNLSDVFLAPQTLNNTEDFLESILKGENRNNFNFVIADINTEEYFGQIDLFNLSWKNRSAEIGIVIGSKENRGRGLGSEALKLIQEFAFNRLNLNRLVIEVHSYNTRAHKCYLKSGFKEEGRRRQAYYMHGKYCDTIVLSLLKSEYEEVKSRFS